MCACDRIEVIEVTELRTIEVIEVIELRTIEVITCAAAGATLTIVHMYMPYVHVHHLCGGGVDVDDGSVRDFSRPSRVGKSREVLLDMPVGRR